MAKPTPQTEQIVERLERLEAIVHALELELQALQQSPHSPRALSHQNGRSSYRAEPPTQTLGLLAKLSPRECQVLRLFAEVRICKKVARALGTEPQTVRNQLTSIRTKLGAATREEFWEVVLEIRPWLKHG